MATRTPTQRTTPARAPPARRRSRTFSSNNEGESQMKAGRLATIATALALLAGAPNTSAAKFAGWFDGVGSAGGNPIFSTLTNSYGTGAVVFVTTINLETP